MEVNKKGSYNESCFIKEKYKLMEDDENIHLSSIMNISKKFDKNSKLSIIRLELLKNVDQLILFETDNKIILKEHEEEYTLLDVIDHSKTDDFKGN